MPPPRTEQYQPPPWEQATQLQLEPPPCCTSISRRIILVNELTCRRLVVQPWSRSLPTSWAHWASVTATLITPRIGLNTSLATQLLRWCGKSVMDSATSATRCFLLLGECNSQACPSRQPIPVGCTETRPASKVRHTRLRRRTIGRGEGCERRYLKATECVALCIRGTRVGWPTPASLGL